jgi:shikimate kinase
MGTGKSVVGALLAGMLGRPFFDLDREIESAKGMPVAEIFRTGGEERFREIEKKSLADLCRREGIVLATGGGAVCDSENLDVMKRSGLLVCLAASPSTIVERLEGDVSRPLLAVEGQDKAGHIKELIRRRASGYAAADVTVSTDGVTPEQVADELRRKLREHGIR